MKVRQAAWCGSGLVLMAVAGTAAGAATDASDNPAAVMELPQVEVVGTTPLPGLGLSLRQIPANVRTATGAEMQQQHTLDLADFMNQNLSGVSVNETAANPFQPDVDFRGFTASPLLGTAQGLSVYVDGVRVNESFGDVVNWDLIPQSSISTIALTPGSNPAFGLNTLGGALSVQTKSGRQYPGSSAELYGGSFGRRAAEFESGGAKGAFDWFLTGNFFDEDGWRDVSPSHVRQLFGKTGWENQSSDVDLSYAWADTNLTGSGLSPQSFLAQDRAQVFTPDGTKNHLNFVNLRASHFLSDELLIGANTYFRQIQTVSVNGDVNDDYADDYADLIAAGGACAAAADPQGCAGAALSDQTARNNRGLLTQRTWGLTSQLTWSAPLAGRANQLVVGASYDAGRSDFAQTQQDATFGAGRSVIPTAAASAQTSLYGTNGNTGIYATDTYALSRWFNLNASARYNRTRVQLDDRLGTALDGEHHFNRLNPSLGFTVTPNQSLTVYADYNEGSRAPTPIELGCADPNVPCKLPNAMASDPPLKQVVARTMEAGARGRLDGLGGIRWSAALFRTRSSDDIQFIASSVSGSGYFANVGDTLRQGMELGLNGTYRAWSWHFSYNFVDATYRSGFDLVSEDNSSADANGFISAAPGDRIPLVPRHTGKFDLDYALSEAWSIGANLSVQSGEYVRGDENNQHQPGTNAAGDSFLGSGRVGGFAVVNLNTRYQLSPKLALFARINNLLDRDYATSGALGANPFAANGQFQPNPDDWTHETFYSPGAPLGVWAGIDLKL